MFCNFLTGNVKDMTYSLTAIKTVTSFDELLLYDVFPVFIIVINVAIIQSDWSHK